MTLKTVIPKQILRLCFHPRLAVSSESGISVLPKSKKARALLAFIALSEGKTVDRVRVASLLWSNLERPAGLTRLRNTLHRLQNEFSDAGFEPLRITNQVIALAPSAVWLDVEQGSSNGMDEVAANRKFLGELDGVDPAFDRWLTHIRQDRCLEKVCVESVGATYAPESPRGGGAGVPTLAVTEIEAVGPGVEEQLTRAFTEEIGNSLARTRWFKTITRSTRGHRLSAGSDDVFNIANYLLVGTIRCDKDCYRLMLKLLDVSDSAIIVWAESYEEPAATVSLIQQKVADMVATRLDTDLLLIEADRLRRLPRHKKDAYTLVLLAIPAIYRLDQDQFLGAGHALEEAISVDRDSAFAHSWYAYWLLFLIGQGWAANPSQSMAQAGKAAERAMMLDPKDARAMTISGHVKAYLGRHLDQAAALHELAIQANPALALGWHLSSVTHAYAGRLDDAYRCILHCLELAPNNPHGFYAEGALGIIHLLRGEYQAAAAIGRRVTERHPQFSSAYKSYLASLGHLGRKSEAKVVLQRLLVLEPKFSLQRFRASSHYRRIQDLDSFMVGFRLAGLI